MIFHSGVDSERLKREANAMEQIFHNRSVFLFSSWLEQPPVGSQFEADHALFSKLQWKGNVKHFFNYKPDSSFLYIQMELCKFALTSWLKDNTTAKSRHLSRIKGWFKQIVEGVEYLHDKNLIHRDLKPDNIIFVDEDNLKICDLDIAVDRIIDQGTEMMTIRNGTGEQHGKDAIELTVMQTCRGTKDYMSPEQLSICSHLNAKSDVFTLGLILAELCVVNDYDRKVEVFNNFQSGKPNDILSDLDTAGFVDTLTNIDASERPSCKEMLTHPFFDSSVLFLP
ncbi:hypothetical protein PMAYCL1PPCAC_09292 [Pristionchus mayeri]|uniref:Protein kinase domain-containing protein n=1 Tax=Pristionchus mayeri TaxID=1317129 RepID=A0AAN4ZDE4_9BILA|nr:hypothetical protein PMAYCL1PPCAC_09292 [Pristionchus mayeri]